MDEKTAWEPTVEAIETVLRSAGIDEPLSRCVTHTGGYSHLVFDLNDRYILRCSTRHESAVHFQREAATLRRLRDLRSVARVIARGAFGPCDTWQYLLLTRVPGENVFRLWFDAGPAIRDGYIRDMVDMIRPVHALPVDCYTFGFYQSARVMRDTAWSAGHAVHFAWLLRRARRMPLVRDLPDLIDRAEAYFARHHEALEYARGPRLAHGDLHLYNVLANNHRVTGIIDWEHAHGSEPDFDLANLIRWALYPAHPAEEALEEASARTLFAPLLPVLLNSYPEVATVPRLLERMTIYQIEHDLHQIAHGGTHQPAERLRGWLQEGVLDQYFS
jgi:aminoglycoside phosphotransferase (APT) family kinase protein